MGNSVYEKISFFIENKGTSEKVNTDKGINDKGLPIEKQKLNELVLLFKHTKIGMLEDI